MEYNPADPMHRRELAQALVQRLTAAGFMEAAVARRGIKERVFYRPIDNSPGMRVQVYTSIVGYGPEATVRSVGNDAIRVCGIYRSNAGQDRGIVTATRVHRTGEIQAICDRTIERAREVWAAARRSTRCSKCGAPTFTSKKGNEVCAELCFKRGEES